MRWRRTSIDQILASPVVESIGLAAVGGSMGSMGMESVAEDVGRPRRLCHLLWVPGSMGWDNSLSEMGLLRTSMLRTGPMRTGSRRLLRNYFTTCQYDFGKITITTRSSIKVVFQRGDGAAGNKGKNQENLKPGTLTIDIEARRVPGRRDQSPFADYSDRCESFDFFSRPASGLGGSYCGWCCVPQRQRVVVVG